MKEKDKNKKIPYNTFRKGVIAGILGLTLGFTAFGLAGCSDGVDGKDGANGKDGLNGPAWHYGVDYNTYDGTINVGDFFIDTDNCILYKKTATGWDTVMENFGKPATATNIELQVASGKVQWRYKTGDDTVWKDLIEVSTITGKDGKEIELQVGSEYIQWRYITGEDTAWKNFMLISSLKGTDGATWLSGTTEPTTEGKNGDFYLNESNYDIWKKSDGTWNKIGNIKGVTGSAGSNIYVGYDGYVWQDGVRTTFKLDQDTEGRENVVEDTIGAYTTMGYWAGEYVDLSTNTIALMANYKPNAKLTQYSGTKVTEIQVVAESTGTLHIGTAKVADAVSARTTGSTYTATTTSYNITAAGVNTITLDLTVAEDETIVIGGSGSTAKVYVVKNLPVSDEQGNFALINDSENTDVLAKTGDYADTLAVRVKASVQVSTQLVSGYDAVKDLTGTSSGVVPCAEGNMPFVYSNTSYFTNKTITKIQLLLSGETFNQGNAGTALQDETEYTFDISVIAVDSLVSGGTFNIKRTYTLRVKGKDVVANAWNEFDISDLGIVVGEGETLGFGSSSSTLANKYSQNNVSNSLHYWGRTSASDAKLKERTTMNLLVGVEGLSQSGGAESFALHLAELEEKEQEVISKNA